MTIRTEDVDGEEEGCGTSSAKGGDGGKGFAVAPAAGKAFVGRFMVMVVEENQDGESRDSMGWMGEKALHTKYIYLVQKYSVFLTCDDAFYFFGVCSRITPLYFLVGTLFYYDNRIGNFFYFYQRNIMPPVQIRLCDETNTNPTNQQMVAWCVDVHPMGSYHYSYMFLIYHDI